MNPYGYLVHLDGTPGVIDSARPSTDPLTWLIYSLGDMFCHQQQERTFMLNGSELAFCQRDFSIIVGLAVGLAITDRSSPLSLLVKKKWTPLGLSVYMSPMSRMILNKWVPSLGFILIASTLTEWALEHVVVSFDDLFARTATGVAAGIGAALLIQYFMCRQYRSLTS
ncbi:MAG: DUF2085 domain-containing protein [Candidatus Methanoplasma sp.]|nr:DUF2085 domain-containing protein [Candidatus Methanoplasma sp.]